MKSFLVFFSILVIFVSVNVAFYPEEYCPENTKHIANVHKHEFNYRSCSYDIEMVPMTDNLKQVLVDAHNAKRNIIAGGGDAKHIPACRMATMKWDVELADLADLHIKTCMNKPDECHNTYQFRHSGQNLHRSEIRDLNFSRVDKLNQVVEEWYSEVEKSNQYFLEIYPDSYHGPDIGHFITMMIEHNTHIGCAAATFTTPYVNNLAFQITCNYASWPGKTAYKTCGAPAIYCETGTNPKYPNLCSASERYYVNDWFWYFEKLRKQEEFNNAILLS